MQTYDQWSATRNFATPEDAAFDADPDGDGVRNGAEFGFGTDPLSGTSNPRIRAVIQDRGGDTFFTARFTRPAGANRGTDLQFITERSDDLVTWTTEDLVIEVEPGDAAGTEVVTVRPRFDLPRRGEQFLRIRVVRIP